MGGGLLAGLAVRSARRRMRYADGVPKTRATLAQERLRVTLFLTGSFGATSPRVARAMAATGMRLGDHSVGRPLFTELTDAEIGHEVLGARSQIVAVTRSDPWPWFECP